MVKIIVVVAKMGDGNGYKRYNGENSGNLNIL